MPSAAAGTGGRLVTACRRQQEMRPAPDSGPPPRPALGAAGGRRYRRGDAAPDPVLGVEGRNDAQWREGGPEGARCQAGAMLLVLDPRAWAEVCRRRGPIQPRELAALRRF